MAQTNSGRVVTAEERKAVLVALQGQKSGFRWTIEKVTYPRDVLMKAVEEDSDFGRKVIEVVSGSSLAPRDSNAPTVPNALGKRYECVVCGTQALCTKKAGEGRKAGEEGVIACCGQDMLVMQARKLPSSD